MTITVYGANWCGDCRRTKRYLDEHGIAYDDVNLEVTPEAAAEVLERNNGLKRIPVVVFPDGSHLTEPSNEALATKLAELAPDDQCAIHARSEFAVVDNVEASRFELQRAGEVVSVADYALRDGAVVIPHVGTEPRHRGQGYAGKLMDGVLDQLRASDRKVVPLCPFAAAHIRDNPRHHDLLA